MKILRKFWQLFDYTYAKDGKQEIVIRREFDLPLELLFKAYEEPELFEL